MKQKRIQIFYYLLLLKALKHYQGKTSETQILLNPQDIKLVEEQFGADHIKEQGWRLLLLHN